MKITLLQTIYARIVIIHLTVQLVRVRNHVKAIYLYVSRSAGVMAYKADGKLRKATEEEENLPDTKAAVHLVRKLFLQVPPEGRA